MRGRRTFPRIMRRKSAACPMVGSGAIGAWLARRRAMAATNTGTAAAART
jgi:hypothetical protein